MRASQLALEYTCPVEVTLEVIGGKWKCVILWWLRRDAKRFSELRLLIPGITQKVLTQKLRELERDGLIRRETYRETPPRVEYSLTPYGETVRPITELMCNWGKNHKSEYEFGYLRLKGLRILVVATEAEVRVKRLRSEPLGASS
ncbi:MAG: helix-turn-helix transcriptional regulator, partial [Scytonema sp. CRU_2_7]|nr:helix-turn-helix transcriptional regulator [Scytonema sp. CRU_2_7]